MIIVIVQRYKTAAILYLPFIVALLGFKDHQGILMKNLLIIIKRPMLKVFESFTVQFFSHGLACICALGLHLDLLFTV